MRAEQRKLAEQLANGRQRAIEEDQRDLQGKTLFCFKIYIENVNIQERVTTILTNCFDNVYRFPAPSEKIQKAE